LRREVVVRPLDVPDLLRERADEPEAALPLVPPELFDDDAFDAVRLAAGLDAAFEAVRFAAGFDAAFEAVRLAAGFDAAFEAVRLAAGLREPEPEEPDRELARFDEPDDEEPGLRDGVRADVARAAWRWKR